MENTIKTGRNIKTIRLLKNLTQEHVAHKSGISIKWLSKIENELEESSHDHFKAIAKALDVSENELTHFDKSAIFERLNHVKNANKELSSTERIESLYIQMIQEKDKRIKELQDKINKSK